MITVVLTQAPWTPELVWSRIVEAANVLKRLPSDKPAGYRSLMPTPPTDDRDAWIAGLDYAAHGTIWGDPWKLYKQQDTRLPARSNDIDRADEVMGWVATYPLPKERIAIWWCAAGLSKARLARKQHCHRAQIKRWRDKGVERIVRGLNG